MSDNHQPSIWNGQVFSDERIAVQLVADSAAIGSPRFIVVGTCASDVTCVLPDRIARFLDHHQDKLLVSMNAAEFHWFAWQVLSRAADHEGLRTLWRFSEQLKLADVRQLQELVVLAGSDPASRSLAPSDPDSVQLLDPGHILVSFGRLHELALELARSAGIDDGTIDRYGPLGLGIQIKGAIALHRAGQRPLRINVPRRAEVESQIEELRADCERAVDRIKALRQCYKPVRGEIRFSDHQPVVDSRRLRKWLSDRLADNVNFEGAPIPGPHEPTAGVSLSSEKWGILRRGDPLIRAWARFAEVSHALRLGCRKESIDVTYTVIPRIYQRPDADVIEQLVGRALFEPYPGKQFVVGEFVDLELRAFAFHCRRCYGPSKLAELIEQASDAVQTVADYLGSVSDFRRCFTSAVVDGGTNRQKVTRVLLTSVANKLSSRHVVDLLRLEAGIEIRLVDAERLLQVVIGLFPEVRAYLDSDAGLNLISRNLQVDVDVCRDALARYSSAEVCRAINGLWDGKDFQGLFFQLLRLNRNDRIDEFAIGRSGSNKLAELILVRGRKTPTGRVRGSTLCSEFVAEHLDIADDVIKAAAFALVLDGADLVAVINGKWVVETSVENAEDDCRRLSCVTSEAAREILGGLLVPSRCKLKTAL